MKITRYIDIEIALPCTIEELEEFTSTARLQGVEDDAVIVATRAVDYTRLNVKLDSEVDT